MDPIFILFLFGLAFTGLGIFGIHFWWTHRHIVKQHTTMAALLAASTENEQRLRAQVQEAVGARLHAERLIAGIRQEAKEEIKAKTRKVAERYLKAVKSDIDRRLNGSNFTQCRDKLEDAFQFLDDQGIPVPKSEVNQAMNTLKAEYQQVLRQEFQKEEQARIRERIRQEEREAKELERELRRLQGEQEAVEKALAAALAKAKGEHSAEVERLQRLLTEAEERNKRAMSMAQQTKAGYVYVISNLGSFGERMFKVGMTRRLEPLDRVAELGDASVPFPFDVHMMISCEDAPKLENTLHRHLHMKRVNRVNLRKEFFNVSLDEIREVVERAHGKVEFTAEPEAVEYRESRAMKDEDFAQVTEIAATFDEDQSSETPQPTSRRVLDIPAAQPAPIACQGCGAAYDMTGRPAGQYECPACRGVITVR